MDFAPNVPEFAYQMLTRLAFWVLTTRYPQGRCADFDAQYVIRRLFAQGCAFWGSRKQHFTFSPQIKIGA